MRKQKHTVLKRIFAFTLAAAMAVGSNFSVPGTAGTVEAATTYTGTNIESQNRDYTGQGKTTKSYISKTSDDKIMVVQAIYDGTSTYPSQNDATKIVVEYYDENYKIQDNLTKTISMPNGYTLFGGFYEKGSNYYLVVGKDNSQTANSAIQCWQIIKYNKEWNKVTSVNVGGNNTSIPFSNGDVSFAECGNYLVIRTCHSTVKTAPGSYYFDQGSATIVLDTATMTVSDNSMSASSETDGFIRNSFAQFVKMDGNKIVSAELTNQEPRGIVLLKYKADASTGKIQSTSGTACEVISAFKVPKMDDYTYINTSLGGFEITDSAYLVAGSSSLKVMGDDSASSVGGSTVTRNVFVSMVDKSDGTVTTKWLTDYSYDTNSYMYNSTSTPHMVKLPNNNYMVLWSVVDKTTKKNFVYYNEIDGSGNIIGTQGKVEGNLSDCVPTVIDGKLVWYTWKNDSKTFYEINLTNLVTTVISTGAIEVTTFNLKADVSMKVGETFTLQPEILPTNATNPKIDWSIDDSSVATINANGQITAVAAGKAKVTGKTTDGSNIERYCMVTVVGAESVVPISSISLNPTTLTVNEGESEQIVATITPGNTTESVVWESSDTSKATVSNSGKVTGISAGTVYIYASSANCKAKCTVTVKAVTHPVTGVTLSKTELTLTIGETEKLTAGVLPSNATNKAVTWSSSKSTVAEVAADGTVTAKTAGETDITVTTVDGGKTASCKVTVSEGTVSVTDVKLNKDTLSLVYGGTATLEATVLPDNATNKTVSWESDNAQVASVENGKITAKGPGKAVITVKTEDGDKKATCTVTVTKPYDTPDAPTAESKTADSVTLKKQDGCQYSMDGKSWSDNNVFSDLKPATEYTFYVKKPGDGQYYTDSAAASAKIKTEDRKATAITLDQTEVTVEDGTQNVIQLTATLTPDDVTNKTIKWSSNDETVAAVDQTGKVTAKQEGTATITAATTDGTNLTATCTITVNAKIISVESVTLDKKEITLTMGEKESDTLNATVNPEAATNKTVLWKTSDSKVATVSDGEVTAVGAGATTITAYAEEDADIKAECTVKVYQKYAAPSAPTKKSVTASSVTLNPIDGCVYSMDGQKWQSSNVFSGLAANTAYTFYAKRSASGYYLESDASTGTEIRTDSDIVAVTGVRLNATSKTVTIKSGDILAFNLTATVSPANATNKKVTWSSSNTGVATVTASGTVSVKKGGTTVITVTTEDGGKTATCTLTVKEEPAEVPQDPTPSDPGQTGPSISDPTPAPAYVPNINVTYKTHVQSFGWQDWKQNGQMAGTSGLAKRLESINISVASAESGHKANLGVQYTTHVQSYGWMPWSANGDASGTEGEAKRLEAIKIQLTGADKDNYDIYYRVHAQSYGWLGWAKNGAPAGTAGYAKRLEGIQIVVVKKDQGFDRNMGGISSAYQQPYVALAGTSPVVGGGLTSSLDPQIGGTGAPNVTYRTHVQSIGWQGWKFNGQMSGTSGQAKRLEGIEIKLTNQPYPGDILYTTHVQSYGWQGDVKNPLTWRRNGVMAGTSGQAKRLEAICITLTGEMAEHYDIYYRVHAQSFGWLGWAKNGAPAGTAGYAKRLEGINIVLVPKGGSAPGSTVRSYVEK